MDARTLLALARYNRWANERVLDCVSRLDDAARSEPAPGTAGSIAITLAHLANTEVYFTAIVCGEPFAQIPNEVAWGELRAVVKRADAALEALVQGYGDVDAQIFVGGVKYVGHAPAADVRLDRVAPGDHAADEVVLDRLVGLRIEVADRDELEVGTLVGDRHVRLAGPHDRVAL